ncbi:MAG: homocysteine S-methyltransferase family protein [Candidatus Eisenbacteria bacterium]|nr:homocysteine S-methyltransferase family protein [Candidatus Eisenbacteria bacterium]
MGTALISRGLPSGEIPDLWNLERASEVSDVHASYVEAGAQLLTANSFGSNQIRLRARKAEGLCGDLNLAAVRIARRASGGLPVAGDIGPTGEMLAPLGRITEEEAFAAFRDQARHLAAAGVDLFIVETFFNAQEARCALRAVRNVCSLPVWVSLTFRRTARGFFTVYGDRPVPSLTRLLEEGAEKAGANCTLASPDMAALARDIVPDLGVQSFFQPNAGEPEAKNGTIVYPELAVTFAGELAAIASLGAGALGGCCGTTPEHIEALACAVMRRSS